VPIGEPNQVRQRISPAFGYPAKDHALAWRPAMRI
jgi:hypothetical protein